MKHPKRLFRRALSLLLTAAVLAGVPSPAALASPAGSETGQASQPGGTGGFAFQSSQEVFPEDCGKVYVTVTRTGDLSGAAEVTLNAYDMSASYGEDYILLDGEAPAEKIDGSRSVFDAFKEDGILFDKQETDMAMLEGVMEMQETGLSPEELMAEYGVPVDSEDGEAEESSAPALELLDQIGARAASLTLRFAPWQDSATVELEILEDETPEYSESFMLGLTGGEAAEGGAVFSGSIRDNEEDAPMALVSFDQPDAAEDAAGTAQVWMSRKGDLATMSSVLVRRDGAPYGYVSFNPYQEQQLVELPRGIYALSDASGCSLGEAACVTVEANPVATAVNAAGLTRAAMDLALSQPKVAPADPELDTVPVYSEVPPELSGAETTARLSAGDGIMVGGSSSTIVGKPAEWQEEWAKNGSYEDENFYIDTLIMQESNGKAMNTLFRKDDSKSSGKYQNFKAITSNNQFCLDTHGGESAMRQSKVTAKTSFYVNSTGMESYTLNYRIEGLSRDMMLSTWYDTVSSGDIKIHGNKSGEEITVPFASLTSGASQNMQSSTVIYVQNRDPSDWDDGCQMMLANAIKETKRKYLFNITGSNELQYTDGKDSAIINEADAKMLKTMWMGLAQDAPSQYKIPLRITYSGDHVMRVKGFQLVNPKGNQTSNMRELDGSDYILFNRSFLEKLERDYCYSAMYSGSAYSAFDIRLVVEKEAVSYSMEESALGGLVLTNAQDGKLYKGDDAVFQAGSGGTEGTSLSGVFVRAKTVSNNEWKTWTVHADSDHLVRVHLDRHYDEYVFQPVYSASADVLTVSYAGGAQSRGQLVIKEGQAVAKDEYVKNDYVALAAKANEGYVTQWTSNGRVFYGDVFHYQLDGNPDNNAITVDFVKADLTTETISGSLSVTDANLYLSSLSGSKPLGNTEWSVVSTEEYKGRTDAQGRYTIEGFRGVKGGTYSMLVLTESVPSYRHFTLGNRNTYSERMPQFGPGIFFPESVRVRLDNSGEDSNLVELRPESNVEITVEVFNQEQSPYDIARVELHLMGVDSKNQNYLADTVQAQLDSSLTHASGGGNFSYYTAKVQAQNLPQDTRLYVNVVANMQTSGGTTAEVHTGDVNTGYEFIAQINDTTVPIQDDVPIIPGATAAADVSLKDLDIPFIGALDFSVGANNGAFFVRAADPNDPSIYTLTAGYSMIPTFGVTNPSDRYDQTKKNAEQLKTMSSKGLKPLGDTSGAGVNAATDTTNAKSTEAGQEKKENAKGSFTTPKLYIQPAVFLKFSMKTYVNEKGDTVTDLIGYDAVIGVDTRVVVNVTANIYGVPCYVCVSIANETYVETQGKLATGEGAIHADGDKTEIIYNDNRGELTNWDVCLQVPILTGTVKGGVGFNNFSSFYLQGKFSFKLGVDIGPGIGTSNPNKVGINAGGSISFGFGGGMDILVFSPNIMLSTPEIGFGNEKIRNNIFPVTSNKPGTLSAAQEDGIAVESLSDALESLPTQQDLMDALNNATFTPAERKSPGALLRTGTVSSQVLMDNAFKGTKVKLTKLDGGKIMAAMLADNGAREGSYNFLSAAYAISDDEGKTWNSVEKISESGSLQFDTNIFELEDKLLITWSEGDIDAALEKKSVEELTAADMAAALNAMDLKGRFFDKATGEPTGEAFTIGENPGVACSMLEAIESDGKVYCYYERCQFPTSGEVTLETIAQRERTIACAVKDGEELTTRQVRAQSQDGKEDYRIMEVVPFSHKGIVGEAVVIDRDGKLALKDASGQWAASNTDRQIFVRFYAATGEPVTTALVPVTDPDSCAQHVEVVSNGDQLYMLWNQDGEIVYLNEFAVPASEKDSPQAAGGLAIVDTATGEVTLPEHEDDEEGYGFGPVAQHSTIHLDRAFDASISSGGDVLVSWVADEEPEDKEEMKEYLTEEVFGVVLKTVEENGLYHLEPVGSPVALTDEESALDSVDGVCLSDDSFLIAYAKLNGDTRVDSDSAQVKAVRSVYEPDLRIQSVSAPTYPMPGSEMAVTVTVGNYGIAPLDGVRAQVTGVGEGGSAVSDEALMPGASLTLEIPVAVPEDFNANAELDVTVSGTSSHTAYTDADQTEVLYGPYFVPDGMAKLNSIPDTSSYVARLSVRNIGNAPGKPEIKYSSYIPGMAENSGKLEQTFRPEMEIEPQGSAMITSKINETPVADDQTIRVQVSLGDGYDQNAESYAPSQRTSDPQQPSDPQRPSNPQGPSNPQEPSEPQEPSNPQEPSDPQEPGDPQEPSEPQEKHHPFVDVPDTAWYAKAVQRVYTLGLMVGIDPTHFAPNMETSRAMLAQVLYRMEGSPKVEKSVAYHDVPDNAWYADAVQWATRQGLFAGYGDGRFGPDDPATREQTAAVLYRYAKWKGLTGGQSEKSIEDFSDYTAISSWAKEAMAWAVENGVIGGKDGGVLDPKGTSIRAELAQQLSKMF